MKSHCKTNITVKDKHEAEGRCARIRRLSEAIILQAIEDLWIKEERERCFNFFTGEEFSICARTAGMNFHDQLRVLNLVWNIPIQNSEIEVGTTDTLEKKTGTVYTRRHPESAALAKRTQQEGGGAQR